MALNPLESVTDYQSMLNRIFWFTSFAMLGALYLLRSNLPGLDAALEQIDIRLETASGSILPIPGGYLLPALGVGLVARIFRPHSHIAHALGIRERFETTVIIANLAREIGIDTNGISADQWMAHRHHLMRQTFYRFTSGSSPEIDKHLVNQALDSWSWFWIGVEATLVFVLASLALIATNCYQQGAIALATTLLLAAFGLPAIHAQCRRYAEAQVDAIVTDAARKDEVRRAFEALGHRTPRLPRAA